MKYIGETERTLKERVCEHIGYINTKKLNEPACEHFNLIGHTMADMSTSPRESEIIQSRVQLILQRFK